MALPLAPSVRTPVPAPLAGLVAAAAVAALALVLGAQAPLLGAPVVAILLGTAIRSSLDLPATLAPGLTLASRTVLQAAIVVSGAALSLPAVLRVGLATLPVMLATIGIALVAGRVIGPRLGLCATRTTLISIGTAICGASAIAAVAAVTEPADADVALAIGVVFAYNVAAVLTFPALGHVLHLSAAAFGVWAGTAINDTSSVVAAGYAYGPAAGAAATIVKLTRALAIVPIVAALGLLRARADRATRVPWRRVVPWFILWFTCAAGANSAGWIPAALHDAIGSVAVALIAVALAAIGLQIDVRHIAASGWRALLLGGVLSFAVATTSLLVQHAVGR